jgi:hypothetical protein
VSKSQAEVIINTAGSECAAAAEKLQASKFSESALTTFRQNISGALKRAAPSVAEIGWKDGFGRGPVDPNIARQFINEQLAFLENWIADISQQGKLVGGAGRARMYGSNVVKVYQSALVLAGSTRAPSAPNFDALLPVWPRDGGTPCNQGCQCSWSRPIMRDPEVWEISYKLGQSEHCEGCIKRSQLYNPLRFLLIGDKWELFTKNQEGAFQTLRQRVRLTA